MQLYSHQQKIIDENPLKCLLALGTGTGKTRVALELAEGKTLVICPKQQKLDQTWQNNAKKFKLNKDITVVSKEEFRRDWEKIPKFDTVICDEAHTLLGILPDTREKRGHTIPKSSQLFEAILYYLRRNPPTRLYLCSATPVSKPMHLFALGVLLGKWSMDRFYQFREKFYYAVKIGQRRIFLPRANSVLKERLAELTKSLGYTGTLNDFFDVPDQTHHTVYVELTREQKEALREIKNMEADALVKRAKQRSIENGVLYTKRVEKITNREERLVDFAQLFPTQKIDYIIERAIEFPKLLIFANYTAQIKHISNTLKDLGYNVSELTGQTKDRENLIKDAENSTACIVIAQCAISEGYELPSFPCVIYASKSYRFTNYDQSLGRVLRSNALKKNLYIHLLVKDSIDELCHKTILQGADFQEMVMN